MAFGAVELFAGAGGLMYGLETSGFKTMLANEVHADPCKTLEFNFPKIPVICNSVRDFSGKSLLEEAGYHKSHIGNIKLVAGGPPCQGFSTAGMKDKKDPRNTLIGDFIRLVNDLKPEFFIMENVTGLKTLHSGKLFENVMNDFVKIKYDITHGIIFAANYGVPQMRRRLIIIGSRDGKSPDLPAPTHACPGQEDLFTLDYPKYITCGEAIADLPEIKSGEHQENYNRDAKTDFQKKMRKGSNFLHNHVAGKHSEKVQNYLSLIPPGGTNLDIPIELRNKKQGIQRWPVDGISRTITTEPSDFVHPWLNRVPTVRETARIQTFPDKYVFLGQRTTGNKMRRLGYCSQTQQVGNAVPPLMAEALGNTIMSLIG